MSKEKIAEWLSGHYATHHGIQSGLPAREQTAPAYQLAADGENPGTATGAVAKRLASYSGDGTKVLNFFLKIEFRPLILGYLSCPANPYLYGHSHSINLFHA